MRGHRHIRVLVVDDHEHVRTAVGDVVDSTDGFELAGCVASGEEALACLERERADLVLMDVRMPGLGGIEAARAGAGLPGPPAMILMSGDDYPDILADPLAHGALRSCARMPSTARCCSRCGPTVRGWPRRNIPRRFDDEGSGDAVVQGPPPVVDEDQQDAEEE